MIINWFKKKFRNLCIEAWNTRYNDDQIVENDSRVRMGTAIGMSNYNLNSQATLQFTVYNAIGGKVIEFRRYDNKNDRSDFSMYVVGKDEDFGEKIAKIATLETLKS
jgi:hypothetical protein